MDSKNPNIHKRPPNFQEKVDRLLALHEGNLSEHDAGVALDQKNYDVDAAAEFLFDRQVWEFQTVSKTKATKATKEAKNTKESKIEDTSQQRKVYFQRKELATKQHRKELQPKPESEEQAASPDAEKKPNTSKQYRHGKQQTDEQYKPVRSGKHQGEQNKHFKERRDAHRVDKVQETEEAKETVIQLQSNPKAPTAQPSNKHPQPRQYHENRYRQTNLPQEDDGKTAADQAQPPRGKYVPRGGKQYYQRKTNPGVPSEELESPDHYTVRIVIRTVQTVTDEIPSDAVADEEEGKEIESAVPEDSIPTPGINSVALPLSEPEKLGEEPPAEPLPAQVRVVDPSSPIATESLKSENAAKPVEKPSIAKPNPKKPKPQAVWSVKQKAPKPTESTNDVPVNKTPFSFGSVVSEVAISGTEYEHTPSPSPQEEDTTGPASTDNSASRSEEQPKVTISSEPSTTSQSIAELSTPSSGPDTHTTMRNSETPLAQTQVLSSEHLTTRQLTGSPSPSASSSTPSLATASVVSPSQPNTQINSQHQTASSRGLAPSPGPQQNIGPRPGAYPQGSTGFPHRPQVAADSFGGNIYARPETSIEDSTESPSPNPPSFTTNPVTPFFGNQFDPARIAPMGMSDPTFMYNQIHAVPGVGPVSGNAPNGKQQGRPHNSRDKFPHNPSPAELSNGMPHPYPFYPFYFPPPYQYPYFPPYQNAPFNQAKPGPNGNFKPANYPAGPGGYPFGIPYPMGFEEESHTYGMPYPMPTPFGDGQQIGPGAAGMQKPPGSAGPEVGGRSKAPLPGHPGHHPDYVVGQNGSVNAQYGNPGRYGQPHGGNAPQYNPPYNPQNSAWGPH